jgi:hypothetical protein
MSSFASRLAQVGLKGLKGGKSHRVGAWITARVVELATADPSQCQINIAGPALTPAYRGLVDVSIGNETYRINKGDTHSAWITKQGECQKDFIALADVLALNPDVAVGSVAVATTSPDVLPVTEAPAVEAPAQLVNA